MHKCHTEGGRYFIGSLAYISVSDQICKEIEIKPNKLSGMKKFRCSQEEGKL